MSNPKDIEGQKIPTSLAKILDKEELSSFNNAVRTVSAHRVGRSADMENTEGYLIHISSNFSVGHPSHKEDAWYWHSDIVLCMADYNRNVENNN